MRTRSAGAATPSACSPRTRRRARWTRSSSPRAGADRAQRARAQPRGAVTRPDDDARHGDDDRAGAGRASAAGWRAAVARDARCRRSRRRRAGVGGSGRAARVVGERAQRAVAGLDEELHELRRDEREAEGRGLARPPRPSTSPDLAVEAARRRGGRGLACPWQRRRRPSSRERARCRRGPCASSHVRAPYRRSAASPTAGDPPGEHERARTRSSASATSSASSAPGAGRRQRP